MNCFINGVKRVVYYEIRRILQQFYALSLLFGGYILGPVIDFNILYVTISFVSWFCQFLLCSSLTVSYVIFLLW